jgi:hypothetical protein
LRSATSATGAPVSATSSCGDRLNTACGWPAAAHRLSSARRSVDQRDRFDEMADRTDAADRIAGVVAHELRVRATDRADLRRDLLSSTRFAPLATTSTGSPSDSRRNRIDFAICATAQPSPAAASAEVLPVSASITMFACPRSRSSSATRRAESGGCRTEWVSSWVSPEV